MKKAFYAINRADELTPRVAEYERAKWYLANNYKQSMLGLLFDNKTSVQVITFIF
jgi:hypothetical protein